MTITIKLKTDNAAFGDNLTERGIELERLIAQVATRLLTDDPADPPRGMTLIDLNSNTVGSVTVRGK